MNTRLKTIITTAVAAAIAVGAAAPAAASNTLDFARAGSEIHVKNDTLSSGVADKTYRIDTSHTGLLAGDWDVDGKDTLAYRSWAALYLHNTLENFQTSNADIMLDFGAEGLKTLAGDFNGDGQTDVAMHTDNLFTIRPLVHLNNVQTNTIAYGRKGDDLLVGDWNGDNRDTFAVRRGNAFHFKYTISGGNADKTITYGRPGDEVFVGDWDGDGIDTLAVRRGNQFHIKDSITGGVADRVISYGRPGDELLVGDWDGDGTDSFIVRRAFPTGDTIAENTTEPVGPVDVIDFDKPNPTPAPTPTVDPNSLEGIKRNYTGRMNITYLNKYVGFDIYPNGVPTTLGFLPKSQYDPNKNYFDQSNWPAEWATTDYNDPANWPADLFD